MAWPLHRNPAIHNQYAAREQLHGIAEQIRDEVGVLRSIRNPRILDSAVRWALPGGGKSGGARVACYYHNKNIPVFLLAAYGKNEKANLLKAERNGMAKLVPVLVKNYSAGGGRKR